MHTIRTGPLQIATDMMRRKEWDNAIATLRNVGKEDPAYGVATHFLGSCYAKKGRLKEAAIWLRETLRVNPVNVVAILELAQVVAKPMTPEQERTFAPIKAAWNEYYGLAA